MKESRKSRNGTIEFWRFVFCVTVVFCHANSVLGVNTLFPSGAIGVEYFFVVSGFLMARSAAKMAPLAPNALGQDTLRFLGKKIRSMCPNYYVAWVIAFAFYSVSHGKTRLMELAATGLKSLWELLFVSMSGLFYLRMNGVVWYISSMLLAMLILYPLLRRHFDLFVRVIAPAAAIFLLGYILQTFGHLRAPTDWLHVTYKGNVRAVAELCLGASLYPVAMKLQGLSLTKFSRILLTILEHACYAAFIYCTCLPKATSLDVLFLFLVAVAVMLSFSGQGLLLPLYSNRFFLWLGEFSFSLYLGHVFYAKWLTMVVPDLSGRRLLLLYLCLALVTGLFIMYASKALKALAGRYGPRWNTWFIQQKH